MDCVTRMYLNAHLRVNATVLTVLPSRPPNWNLGCATVKSGSNPGVSQQAGGAWRETNNEQAKNLTS